MSVVQLDKFDEIVNPSGKVIVTLFSTSAAADDGLTQTTASTGALEDWLLSRRYAFENFAASVGVKLKDKSTNITIGTFINLQFLIIINLLSLFFLQSFKYHFIVRI